MKYQLILQWPTETMTEYDSLIEIEDILIEKLTSSEDVDGHDIGSGEMNIFIGTNDPRSTFERVRSILAEGEYWPTIRAAYRDDASENYIVLWPSELLSFQVS